MVISWSVRAAALMCAALAVSCGEPTGQPMDNPPQVFVVASEANVVGTGFRLFVTVNGCSTVKKLEILESNGALGTATYSASPTEVELTTDDLLQAFPRAGIAADLLLSARATCDDDRVGTSQGVGVRFFPVASVVAGVNGASALPDSFYAEGGSPGQLTSYVGCIGTETGFQLARVNTYGQVVKTNTQPLPVRCSYNSYFTEKNAVTSKRWMLESGIGAVAFDSNLNLSSAITGTYTQLTQGPDGDAIIWDNKTSTLPTLKRISHTGGTVKWEAAPKGIMNAQPVVNAAMNRVFVSMWDNSLGLDGTVTVLQYDYATGDKIDQHAMTTMKFDVLDVPVIPNGQLSADGTVIFFPYQAMGPAAVRAKSGVYACSTLTDNCAATPVWQSPLFEGVATHVVLSGNGEYVAALTGNTVWFLSILNGKILNAEEKGIKASGSLVLHGVQPGPNGDFYVLTGPAGDQFTAYYPQEIIAVESPNGGEVYRYAMGATPTSPMAGLTVAVDEGGTPWLRIGLKQVKPLSLEFYRQFRGPTP